MNHGRYQNHITVNFVNNQVGKSSGDSLPFVFKNDLTGKRIFQNSQDNLIDCFQKLQAKPMALLFVPIVGFLEFQCCKLMKKKGVVHLESMLAFTSCQE